MNLYEETHARKSSGGVQNSQQNYGRRMLSSKGSILYFNEKRGERYLAFTGDDVHE